jgi:hypothetical protein
MFISKSGLAVVAASALAVFDDFQQPDGALLARPDGGGLWTEVGYGGAGPFYTYSGKDLNRSGAGTPSRGYPLLIANYGSAVQDVRCEFIRADTNGYSSLIFACAADGSSYYQMYSDSSNWLLAKVVNRTAATNPSGTGSGYTDVTGQTTVVAAVAAYTGSRAQWRVTYDGAGHVSIYQNDVLIRTWTDASPLTGTWVGVAESTVQAADFYDNFFCVPAVGSHGGGWNLSVDPPGSNYYVSPDGLTLRSAATSPFFTTVVGYGYDSSRTVDPYYYDVISNTQYAVGRNGQNPPTAITMLYPGARRLYLDSRVMGLTQAGGNYFGIAQFIMPQTGPTGAPYVGTPLPFGKWTALDAHYVVSADGQTVTDRGATTLRMIDPPAKGLTAAGVKFQVAQSGTDQTGSGGYQFIARDAALAGSAPTDSVSYNAAATNTITFNAGAVSPSGTYFIELRDTVGNPLARYTLV